MSAKPGAAGWYSVRCVFQLVGEEDSPYEERITLWRATSFAAAIELAEEEAAEYVRALDVTYLGIAQSYYLGDTVDEIVAGTEVFSLVRSSDLPPDEYVDTFFDTGGEYQRTVIEEP